MLLRRHAGWAWRPTPVLLLLLSVLLVAVVARPMPSDALPTPSQSPAASVSGGFLDGYNTLDALAGLAFAIVIIEAIHRLGVRRQQQVALVAAQGGVLAGLAMAAVYGALAWLGATSLDVAPDAENGGTVLAGASNHYFGTPGTALIAAIVVLACLKTAIGLLAACGEMFAELFTHGRGYPWWPSAFTGVSFGLANLGLATILKWSVPVLVLLYPFAIVTIVLGLLTPWIGRSPVIHRWTTGLVSIAAILDFLLAVPLSLPGGDQLERAAPMLPLQSAGFGWVLPAVIGLAVGLVLQWRSPGSA